jgi:peptidoglycan/LPS O-acetylase OafA/YrhL
MSFALMGAFLRFAAQPRVWARYLADASYWCYLVHPPIVLWLQAIIAPWPVPGWPKLVLLTAVTMAVLLVTYERWVRYTWIGTLLNGPRERAPRYAAAVAAET